MSNAAGASSSAEPLERLKVDVEPRRILFTSEPYVVYTTRGYQAAANVWDTRRRREYLLYLSAATLAKPLEQMRSENEGHLRGVEVWIRKEAPDRTARYIVEE